MSSSSKNSWIPTVGEYGLYGHVGVFARGLPLEQAGRIVARQRRLGKDALQQLVLNVRLVAIVSVV